MATGAGTGTGAGVAVTQEDAEYENVLFTTNTLPGTDTSIGNIIANTTIDEQRQRAIDFHTFLHDEDRQLS